MLWAGWSDDPAGIKEYELELNKLAPHGTQLVHHTELLLKTLDADKDSFNISLSDPGKNLNCF